MNMCNTHPDNEYFITTNVQANIRHYLNEWQAWRGTLEKDPVDYLDYKKGIFVNESEWKRRHQVCEACGLAGTDFDPLQKCHIISRGADTIEEPWNWLQLHLSHHIGKQHQQGWGPLIDEYNHLKGAINRARTLAGRRLIDG